MTRSIGGYEASAHVLQPESPCEEADTAALLAEPSANGFGGIEEIYILMSLDSRNDSQAAVRDVLAANDARREAWERQLAALERERQAEEDSGFWGGLFDDLTVVAKVAGVVAAVAFAVGTAGAGSPVAILAISGAVASSASLAQSQWGVFDRVLGKENADRMGFWLGVGGAALCFGAGGLTLLGVGTGAQATALTQAAEQGALVVGGAAAAGAGAAKITQSYYAGEAAEHRAEALQAQLDAETQQLLLMQFVASLEDAKDRETANLKRVVAMNNLQGAAMTTAAEGVG